jgi:tRNA(Ile)-lysidine synthase
LKAVLDAIPETRGFLIACSGGLDSTVLLHALSSRRDLFPQPLRVIHVDHQAQVFSTRFKEFVSARAAQWGVPLILTAIEVPQQTPKGWEAAARQLRYDMMARYLAAGEVLLTGHQADDQMETFLLHLLRGSGHQGLRGMTHRTKPLGAGRLFRPLLGFSRQELKAYAERVGIQWLEDPTNQDPAPSRNYLRLKVIPALVQRWPQASLKSDLSTRLLETEHEILFGFLKETLDRVFDPSWGGLSIPELRKQGEKRARLLLRVWIEQLQAPPVPQRRLDVLIRNLLAESREHSEIHWEGYGLVTHDSHLFLVPPLPEPPRSPLSDFDGGNARWNLWPGWGYLELRKDLQEWLSQGSRNPSEWRISIRTGGERMYWRHAGHQVALKELFRKMRMPPWLRERTPILAWRGSIWSVGGWFWDELQQGSVDGGFGIPVNWIPENPGLKHECSRYSRFLESRR